MLPEHMYFEGLEEIPGLAGVPDDDDPAFLKVNGNCPIIISAPHAGDESTTPVEAKVFGRRQSGNRNNDVNTLKITFALVRTLSTLGAVPNAVINLVSRNYIDMNRTWNGQGEWKDDDDNTFQPEDALPGVNEFGRFQETYYQAFHNTLQSFTEAHHPHGWLFDIHGTSLKFLAPLHTYTLQIVTTQGYTARRDFVYDSPHSLHHYLHDKGRGFDVHPISGDPGDEYYELNAQGQAIMNLISGGRFGAKNPPALPSNLPVTTNVTPGPQLRRIHGVQFEIDGSLRHNRTDEDLESVGINLAYGIYECMLGSGVISYTANPLLGKFSAEWFQTLA